MAWKDEPGILLRAMDGTLYFIPETKLEDANYGFKLPVDQQPGGNNDVQKQLDKAPVVHNLKNALWTTQRDVFPLIEVGSDDGAARPRAKGPNLSEVGKRTPNNRTAKAWSRSSRGETDGIE